MKSISSKIASPILAAVVAVEQTFAGEQPGATKKQIALDLIQSAAKVGEAVPNVTVEMISMMIDEAVTILNSAGVFAHKAPAPVPAA